MRFFLPVILAAVAAAQTPYSTPPAGYSLGVNAITDTPKPVPQLTCSTVNQPFSDVVHYGSIICQNVPAAPSVDAGSSYTDPVFGGISTAITPAGPTWTHPYSLPTPISARNRYVDLIASDGTHRVADLTKPGYPRVPIPTPGAVMWDAVTDDVYYYIQGTKVIAHSLRFGADATIADYTGQLSAPKNGGSSHISTDNWMALWSEPEHQVCALDTFSGKSYCADYTAAAPNNRREWDFIDYSLITDIDKGTHKRYVLLMATPAMGIWSVNEGTGKLDFEARGPEMGIAGVNDPNGNKDGVCDVNENCLSAPHGDVTAYDGIQYYLTTIDLSFNGCERQLVLYPIAALEQMQVQRKILAPFAYCSSAYEWPDAHYGCSLKTGACVITTYTNTPAPYGNQIMVLRDPEHLTRLAFHNSVKQGSDTYWYFSRSGISLDGKAVVYDSNWGRPDEGGGTAHEQVFLLPVH